MPELLLELLSEEIPARMQTRAAEDLKRLVCDGLKATGLSFTKADAFATPRRLALVVDGIPLKQPDVNEERRGPRADAPAQAINGFKRSLPKGAKVEVRDTDKGRFHFARIQKKGGATNKVIPKVLRDSLWKLPWPKSMKWGADNRFSWVRPIHSILCVFAGKTIEFSLQRGIGEALIGKDFTIGDKPIHGIVAGNVTTGHQFLAPKPFKVKDFADYKNKLKAAKVILDSAERRERIQAEAEKLAKKADLKLKRDPGLLDEVAGLVEWPVVRLGKIDKAFMGLWGDVITTVMHHHQKYFALTDAKGLLAPRFVVVLNTETRDGGRAAVAGNERVLKARLADAKFFFERDLSQPLENFVPLLKNLIFHTRLGSVLEKVRRLESLAASINVHLPGTNPKLVRRAAYLCKADLMTQMVGEFPELQGKMGGRYAFYGASHEEPAVATAIAEHYSPRGPNDNCPGEPVSIAVALADKMDTLVGFWSVGEKPTGSRDPFALRRAALGIIRLITENNIRIQLSQMIRIAGDGYDRWIVPAVPGATGSIGKIPLSIVEQMIPELLNFIAERLKVHLREKGVRHDLIDAVFAAEKPGGGREDDLVRLLARVDALGKFLKSSDGANLHVAYKRAANIVRIEEKKDKRRYDGAYDLTLLAEDEERTLATFLVAATEGAVEALKNEDFTTAMAALARLRRPVDDFFDHVTVNCDDAKLRENRLRLLSGIGATLDKVADFSKLEGGER